MEFTIRQTPSFTNQKDMDEYMAKYNHLHVVMPDELFFVPRTKKGTLNLIVASSGVGKSTMSHRMAAILAHHNYKVAIFSLENDPETDDEQAFKATELYGDASCIIIDAPIWNSHDPKLNDLKSELKTFDFIFIDGLDYVVQPDSNGLFVNYAEALEPIKRAFPNSVVYLTWQTKRNALPDDLDINVVQGSVRAVQQAYSIIRVFAIPDQPWRIVRSGDKCRGGRNPRAAVYSWDSKFKEVAQTDIDLLNGKSKGTASKQKESNGIAAQLLEGLKCGLTK